MPLFWLAAVSLAAALGICAAFGGFGSLQWLWALPVSFVGCFLALVLAGFAFLLYLCRRVDQNVPQEDDDPFYRRVTNLVIGAALPFLRIHVKKSGLEKVPTDQRFLLVCNHTNNSDPIILLYAMPKAQLAFISKRENSTMFVIGPMMHKLLCQLINRENDREALKTILRCIQIIREDKASIAVFPEGGIHEDKKFHHFRPGVFKIAQKTNVPIVVCTIQNTRQIFENLKKLKKTDIHLHLVDVISPEQYAGMSTIELGNMVYEIMARDLGPENISNEA